MKKLSLDDKYNFLVECVCSEDFVQGAILIGGYNEDTFDDIIYHHTGQRTFEDYLEDILEN